MKKLLNKLKNNSLFMFILGGLIFGSIGIYGANIYESNAIEYSPTDSSWEVSNVEGAINSLYSMKNELDNLKGIGNATAGNILSGKKAVVKGSTVTGTMRNMSDWWIWTNNGIEEYTYTSGSKVNMVYVSSRDDFGDGYIDMNSKFIVGQENEIKKNLLAGKTLLGVTGTATSDATATASDIKSGKTAYVNGSKITGTFSSNSIKKTLVWTGTIDPDYKATSINEYIYLNNFYSDYKNITASNIGVEQADIAVPASSFGGCSTSWNYTASSGLITLTVTARSGFPNCGKQTYNVYVYTT